MAAQAEALCRAAADVLRRSNKGEGVRQILYSVQLPASTKPQLQAIVLGVQKDEGLVWDVAKRSGLMDKIPAAHLMPDDRLLLVLLYEALLGSRRVRGNADIFTFVKDHKAELQRCLAELRKQGTVEKYQEKIRLPRYARINTLKTNIDAVLTHFKGRGWKVDMSKGDVDESSEGSVVSPPKGTIIADPILDDIIVFPAGTSLHSDPLVYSGAVILQDRSSCLSALALAPLPPSARVADACAAPGNKTSHIAMLHARARKEEEDSSASVAAFERDKHREKMLRSQMGKLGCDRHVQVHGRDFTEAVREARREAEEEAGERGPLWGVTHVLCDPSCSGSGLVAQYHGQKGGVKTGEEEDGGMAENEHVEGGASKEELKAFAAEQTKIVCAALSLPKVAVVVYSTCSVHKEENEEVVAAVLRNCKGRVRQATVLPAWPHRGLPTEGCDGRKCARASHDKDSTNGFFVARFEVGPAKGGEGKTHDKAGGEGAKKRAREEAGEERAEKKAKKEKGSVEKRVSSEGSVKSVKALKGESGGARGKVEEAPARGAGVPAKGGVNGKGAKQYEYGGDRKFGKKGKQHGKGPREGGAGAATGDKAAQPVRSSAWKGAVDVD